MSLYYVFFNFSSSDFSVSLLYMDSSLLMSSCPSWSLFQDITYLSDIILWFDVTLAILHNAPSLISIQTFYLFCTCSAILSLAIYMWHEIIKIHFILFSYIRNSFSQNSISFRLIYVFNNIQTSHENICHKSTIRSDF